MDLPAAAGLQASSTVWELDMRLHFQLVNYLGYDQMSGKEPSRNLWSTYVDK